MPFTRIRRRVCGSIASSPTGAGPPSSTSASGSPACGRAASGERVGRDGAGEAGRAVERRGPRAAHGVRPGEDEQALAREERLRGLRQLVAHPAQQPLGLVGPAGAPLHRELALVVAHQKKPQVGASPCGAAPCCSAPAPA